KGGAAADVIIGGTLSDTLTGGAGNDTFHLVGHANNFIYDTITDATNGDILLAANAGTETSLGKLTLSAAAGFSDYLDVAAAGAGNTNGVWANFVYGGNTYITLDLSAGASFVAGTDLVIELAGVKDLAGTTFAGANSITLDVDGA
ncbi:MAG: hypothetical protein P8N60_01595, partial [Burkholderiaceae bacterium]|nr:hypothetical protein [Burkholderiaceae bacterium]